MSSHTALKKSPYRENLYQSVASEEKLNQGATNLKQFSVALIKVQPIIIFLTCSSSSSIDFQSKSETQDTNWSLLQQLS